MTTTTSVNVAPDGLRIMKNHENRVALEYYRGTSRSRYIGFCEFGPRKFEVGVDDFNEEFSRPANTTKTVAQNVMRLLVAARNAYLPDEGVHEILLKAYQTAVLGVPVEKADMKALCAYYNGLILGIGFNGKQLKKFASKADAAEKLQAVHSWVLELTDVQKQNKADNAAEAKRRLAGLDKVRAAKPQAAAAPKGNGAARPARQAKEKPAGGAQRGRGIGAFCCELILKGKSNEQVLAAAKAQFPDAKTSPSSVAWYRNDLKNKGQLPKA